MTKKCLTIPRLSNNNSFCTANIAQLAEHLVVAQGVAGSNPVIRPIFQPRFHRGFFCGQRADSALASLHVRAAHTRNGLRRAGSFPTPPRPVPSFFSQAKSRNFPVFRLHLAHSAPHRGLFFYSSSASPTGQWSEPYTSLSIHASRILFRSSDDTKK